MLEAFIWKVALAEFESEIKETKAFFSYHLKNDHLDNIKVKRSPLFALRRFCGLPTAGNYTELPGDTA